MDHPLPYILILFNISFIYFKNNLNIQYMRHTYLSITLRYLYTRKSVNFCEIISRYAYSYNTAQLDAKQQSINRANTSPT
jgi:hypothetical protein